MDVVGAADVDGAAGDHGEGFFGYLLALIIVVSNDRRRLGETTARTLVLRD